MGQAAAYVLASRRGGTIYVGATADLIPRVWQHRTGLQPDAFTTRYHVKRLVHFELFDELIDARKRERQLKNWRRAWKIALIEESNPEWRDLWDEVISGRRETG